MQQAVSTSLLQTPGLNAQRWVVTAVFFAFAIGFGLWSGAIPELMRHTGIGAADLGWALTLHSAAYILAMTGGGQLARVVAPRRLILLTLPLHAAGFWALFGAGSASALTLALVAVGVSGGLLDLAMNTEGTAVERAIGRPVLTRMHAAASGAFALGALGGSLLATGLGLRACALVVVAVVLPTLWAVARLGRADAVGPAPAAPAAAAGLGPGPVVAMLGIVLGLSIGAEMCAQMWSAAFLERQASELAAYAGAGAAFFAGCQALMRWHGDTLRRRFGDLRLIGGSIALAAAGFAIVAVSPAFGASLLGFALVGVGTGCIVPCCFALIAQRAPQRAAADLGIASFIAGLIRLPTPLVLGLASASWSDSAVFGGVAASLALGLLMVRRLARVR